jgi:hypothetical protein
MDAQGGGTAGQAVAAKHQQKQANYPSSSSSLSLIFYEFSKVTAIE